MKKFDEKSWVKKIIAKEHGVKPSQIKLLQSCYMDPDYDLIEYEVDIIKDAVGYSCEFNLEGKFITNIVRNTKFGTV